MCRQAHRKAVILSHSAWKTDTHSVDGTCPRHGYRLFSFGYSLFSRLEFRIAKKISTFLGGAKQSGIAKTASKRSGQSGNALGGYIRGMSFQKKFKKIQKNTQKNSKIAAACTC